MNILGIILYTIIFLIVLYIFYIKRGKIYQRCTLKVTATCIDIKYKEFRDENGYKKRCAPVWMSNTARFESFYYVPKSYHINGTEVIRVNPNNPKEYINSARMY